MHLRPITDTYGTLGEWSSQFETEPGKEEELRAALESLTAIVRAGSDLVVSYWTKELAGWL